MKRISKITLILMAAASMTACGKVGERSSLPIPQQPAATVTEAATGTSAEESTTAADTTTTAAADSSETVTTTAADTEAATEAPAANTAAGSSDNTAAAPAQQQSAQTQTANTSSDYNYGPAPAQYDDSRLTYINGVLIANKSYSLPADFAPGLDSTCYNQFCKLSSAAAQEGLNIYLSSGFRSYDYQAQIYNNYCARDGQAAADTYSARPGYSEHQTGLCIDVNTIDDAFGYTQEASWLAEHAHEYGFIIRYPQGKESYTGYKYEPWHIRYVGSKLATKLHKSGQCLEEYLGVKSEYKSE